MQLMSRQVVGRMEAGSSELCKKGGPRNEVFVVNRTNEKTAAALTSFEYDC